MFPEAEVNELGYEVAAHGDGRWNGVALLSSVGLEDVSLGFPGQPSYAGEEAEEPELTLLDEPVLRKPEARAVGATCGGVRVWSLYVPNGRSQAMTTSAQSTPATAPTHCPSVRSAILVFASSCL